jgi:heme/copper-type cytochrome/quinol oxidase subunit 4
VCLVSCVQTFLFWTCSLRVQNRCTFTAKWRQQVSLKCQLLSTRLQNVRPQKTLILKFDECQENPIFEYYAGMLLLITLTQQTMFCVHVKTTYSRSLTALTVQWCSVLQHILTIVQFTALPCPDCLWDTPSSYTVVLCATSSGVKQLEYKRTTHLYSMLRSRISGVMPPHHHAFLQHGA